MDPTTAAGQGTVSASTPATGSPGVGTSAPSVASNPTPASVSSSQAQTSPGSAGSVSSGSGTGTSGQAAPVSTAAVPSPVRDLVRGYGPQYDQLASQFPDDRAFMQHLLLERDRAQQSSQLAPYGQLYLQHQNDFQAFMAQRQAEAEKAQQQQKSAPWWESHWKPPEFDPAWEKLLTRDANGNVVAVPGAPPDLPLKYAQYQQFRQQQADKLMRNPYEFLEPGIRTLAQQIADQAVQRHMGQYQDQVFAQQYTQQNSSWLYQQNAQGQPVTDQTGQPMLSPHGQAFVGYVKEADSLGLKDVRAQQKYALGMVQRDAAFASLQQAQVQPNGDAAKQQWLQQQAAGNRPNQGGSVPQPNLNGNQPPQNASQTLRERLANAFAQNGINDNVLRQQINNPTAAR